MLSQRVGFHLIFMEVASPFSSPTLFVFSSFVVLVGLYEEPERPANAVDYIKRYMGAPAGIDVEALRVEVEQLRAENAQLHATVTELNGKVSFCIIKSTLFYQIVY